jgi:hypothetical protein
MTGLFYKSYWPIAKIFVIASVQSFFIGGFLLKEFDHSNIAFIPKIDNLSQVHHYRPISLINFNYKIIPRYFPIDLNLCFTRLFLLLNQRF